MPRAIYEIKPWVFVAGGVLLAVGATVWSLSDGLWTGWRSICCFLGAALAIVGGVTLQLRHDYRARSKWRRTMRP
jgi:protein-S-isoprenylcysteine O-methyltransferase Ste14